MNEQQMELNGTNHITVSGKDFMLSVRFAFSVGEAHRIDTVDATVLQAVWNAANAISTIERQPSGILP